jgi:hypothetical protein
MIGLNVLFGKSDHSDEAVGPGGSDPVDGTDNLTVIAQVESRNADNLAMSSASGDGSGRASLTKVNEVSQCRKPLKPLCEPRILSTLRGGVTYLVTGGSDS